MTLRNFTDADLDELARRIAERLAPQEKEWAVPGYPLPSVARHGGYIYFAQCLHGDGLIKIGTARNLQNRPGSLRNGCPYPIEFVGYYWHVDPGTEESRLHGLFANARLRLRGEWFSPTPELLSLIDLIQRQRDRSVVDRLDAKDDE